MSSETAKEKPDSRKKKRFKQLLIILFVFVNIVIIYWTASKEFSRDKELDFSETTFHWWLLIPAVVAFVGALALDIYKYFILIRRFTKKKDLRLSAQTVLLGRYYDNITPSAVGGQPFQIHHMIKSGVPSEYAAMIPVIGFVSSQIAFVFLSLLTLIFGSRLVISDVTYAASFFGIVLYAFAPVLILFFAIKPRAAKKLASGLLTFLHKIHIVRHLDTAEEKALGEIEKYAACIRHVLKNKKFTLKIMAMSVAYQLLFFSIPFLVLTAFGGEVNYLSAMMTAISIQTAISFIPTPGNVGVAEGTFYLVFASLGSGNTFWAMLIWRFFSYYSFIAFGGLVYLEMAYKKRKRSASL